MTYIFLLHRSHDLASIRPRIHFSRTCIGLAAGKPGLMHTHDAEPIIANLAMLWHLDILHLFVGIVGSIVDRYTYHPSSPEAAPIKVGCPKYPNLAMRN